MLKQISKIKIFLLELLEKELITVLAIGILSFGVWLVKADTDSTLMSFTILDVGTLTVTAPNGGEDWQIDSSQHITWTSTGSIANVKIELQRTVGGDWETLIASTPNDGDYPWTVTSPTTTTAMVKITSTNVPGITDSSDLVFTISAAPEVPSGPGGYAPTYPLIDSVNPLNFYYNSAIELTIRGLGFREQTWVTLNQVVFPVQQPHSQNLMLMNIPAGTLVIGAYRLCAYNSSWEYDCYSRLINIIAEGEEITPPTTGGTVGEEYSAMLVRQFSLRPADGTPMQTEQRLTGQSPDLTLKPREEATLWVEYKNTGTATWYQDGPNPVRLGTDSKRDRKSGFYHSSWIKYNRPVLVSKVVKPGEIGRFEFTIKAPWTAKIYTEYFKPVAEWKTWVNGKSQVKWVIKVQKVSFWKLFKKSTTQPTVPSTSKPAAPSTGGKVKTPFQPGETLLFSDNIERLYQKTIQVIINLFSKLRR